MAIVGVSTHIPAAGASACRGRQAAGGRATGRIPSRWCWPGGTDARASPASALTTAGDTSDGRAGAPEPGHPSRDRRVVQGVVSLVLVAVILSFVCKRIDIEAVWAETARCPGSSSPPSAWPRSGTG